MKIFLTGAGGFIGRRIAAELIAAGHEVEGLARSRAAAEALSALGASGVVGDVAEPASLDAPLRRAEGVIHTAFDHDFTRFKTNCESDRRAIEHMGAVLAGTGAPLVATSTTMAVVRPEGRPARESDGPLSSDRAPRAATEEGVARALELGANASVVRLPQVHDRDRQGLVGELLEIATRTGVSAYLGAGANRWCGAHVEDVARLYRLAIERAEAGARWHALAEGAIPFIGIAAAVARRTGAALAALDPEAAQAHFGPFAHLVGADAWSDAATTRARLGWTPAGPTLFDDLA